MADLHLKGTGTFEVELKPEAENKVDELAFGRYSIEKKFQGDLEATSRVEMLSAGSENGFGAYVAIEHVTGTLKGRRGAFVLMHSGTRSPEGHELTVSVVPGCGTGELAGLEGLMTITMEGEDHFYDLVYGFSNLS
jgi:hypothetical protein